MSCTSSVLRRRLNSLILTTLAIGLLAGCAAPGAQRGKGVAVTTARVQSLNLNNLVSPAVNDAPVAVAAAKNEWSSFQLQVSGLPAPVDGTAFTLRIQPLNFQSANGAIDPKHFSAYQILSMPVDVNRAGYVRHTGLTAATRLLPRALLPMTMDAGRVNLSAARDPNNPTDPAGRAGASPVMLWIDVHIPPEAPAGAYAGVCDVLQSGVDQPIASVPVQMTVYDFVMPDERHLNLVGEVEWESLTRLYTNRFEAVTPRFLNRTDPRYAQAVKTLDQLVKLAQAHRVDMVVPRLQPNVKWPGGRPPVVTWEDFDSVVGPWLRGDMFADKIPLGHWPLPLCDGLLEYDPQSRRQYWSDAATHFDQNDWLERSPVFIQPKSSNRPTAFESVQLSADAAGVLSAHPRVRVAVPLEDDQVQFGDVNNPTLIRTGDATRLITANPGIVFTSPIQDWPTSVPRPPRWMRTDLTGLIPYVGAGGDERDVRLWSWLSFLPLPPPKMGIPYGPVQFIRWTSTLPKTSNPNQPADPNELLWCYPGSWFGIDEPVPTIQLKWLRRAQQDFEYLYLARQRDNAVDTLLIARLMAKPVEIQPNQTPDPTFGLMPGTSDPKTWDRAMELIAKRILLRAPGQEVSQQQIAELNTETLQWIHPEERPALMGRSTQWDWDPSQNTAIRLRLGIDIYNPSDARPADNTLAWTGVPTQAGWQVQPKGMAIPALATYNVRRFLIMANLDPTRLKKVDPRPLEISFTNGYTLETTPLKIVLPVSITDRREGMLEINGDLDDWTSDDAIQNGPLVRMLNRPALQANVIQTSTNPAELYTGWSDEKFYLAFKLTGLSQSQTKVARNFVDYDRQSRRAWGEDLCQILIQPIYADNSVGPALHVVCKPSGVVYVERKAANPRMSTSVWEPVYGDVARYQAKVPDQFWRGEISIRWDAMVDPIKKRPVMLRFNFSQHIQDTGESASWAGPVDFLQDDAFTGILLLREPETPGMIRAVQN